MGADEPHFVDKHVGARVRARRDARGMSQKKLAEALGIKYQQLQKNKKGVNRIGAGRLYQLSIMLETPITYFYEGLPLFGTHMAGFAEEQAPFENDSFETEERRKMLKAFSSIASPEDRAKVIELTETLAAKKRKRGRPPKRTK